MTPVKAALSVILKANEVVVAEIEDSELWQRVLTAINRGDSILPPSVNAPRAEVTSAMNAAASMEGSASDVLDAFAEQLGVSRPVLEGACSPSLEPPYLHLDAHCWEEMKKHTPTRGVGSIPALSVSATLLALWSKKTEIGIPTQSQAQAVLATIGVKDNNATRSVQSAEWLQGRPGGQIVLNPAQISKAMKLAKCFCSKDWSSWNTAGQDAS